MAKKNDKDLRIKALTPEEKRRNYDKIYSLEKKITPEQFLRATLFNLAEKADVPPEVLKVQFGPIQEKTLEVLCCQTKVAVRTSASVGSSYSYSSSQSVKKIDADGKTYYESVPKTEYETTWTDVNDFVETSEKSAIVNYGERQIGEEVLLKIISSYKGKQTESDVNAISEKNLTLLKEKCIEKAINNATIKGSDVKHQNIRLRAAEISKLNCYLVPYYEVEYTFEGGTYHAYTIAVGDIAENLEVEYPKEKSKISKFRQTNDTLRKTGIAMGIVFAVSVIPCIVIHALFPAAGFLGLIFYFAAIVCCSICTASEINKMEEIIENIFDQKKQALIGVLTEKELPSISKIENEEYEKIIQKEINKDKSIGFRDKKTVIWCSIIGLFGAFPLFITSLIDTVAP